MVARNDTSSFIFGLYKVAYENVPAYLKVAIHSGITHFDIAQLYRNESICAEYVLANKEDTSQTITTK